MTQFGYDTSGSQVVEAFKDVVKGKIFLITGPSDGGIGAETATCLVAGSPALIVLAGRSLGKIQPVIDRINATNPAVRTKFINLELGSQASVREAAASINANVEKIDVLINNAAVMACPFSKTVDGIESQFGTNHIGHFLLTNLIMPKILAAGPGARIVNVSSVSHRMADVNLNDYNFEHGAEYHPSIAYGAAKSANILFTLALARRLESEQVKAISLHPGSVATNLQTYMTPELAEDTMQMIRDKTGRPFERPKLKSTQQGCSTTLVAVLDPSINSGDYLEDCNPAEPEAHATDKQKAEKLWDLSEKLVGQKFDL
ncbi:hypothetical protein JMJ35_005719 [Cladonia borealis]|uniref:Short-chain dehydrogenase n=1 Tax=Cladonia borealis TaxID=184061 RepID=A0AA39R0Z4_9LECA|nr:hypothetical protein JMJ35_005719 [Cladonia borealis]